MVGVDLAVHHRGRLGEAIDDGPDPVNLAELVLAASDDADPDTRVEDVLQVGRPLLGDGGDVVAQLERVGEHLLGEADTGADEGEPVEPPGLCHAAGALVQPARGEVAGFDLLAEPRGGDEDDAVNDVSVLDGRHARRGRAARVARDDEGGPVVHRPFADVADDLAEDLGAELQDLVDGDPFAGVFDRGGHDVGRPHQALARCPGRAEAFAPAGRVGADDLGLALDAELADRGHEQGDTHVPVRAVETQVVIPDGVDVAPGDFL